MDSRAQPTWPAPGSREFSDKGYRAVGGVAIDGNNEGQWLYQAMMHEGEVDI